MKMKINIALKGTGLLIALIIFILGLINIIDKTVNTLNIALLVLSGILFILYIAEWFVTRAWFRIAYWLIFIIVNPIILMDKDNTRVSRNINSSMFIFSIFYLIIMAIAFGILAYNYIKSRKKIAEDINKHEE